MNRSLRAAGGVLAIGAVLTTVLAGIALVDQRTTDGHLNHAGEGAAVEAGSDVETTRGVTRCDRQPRR